MLASWYKFDKYYKLTTPIYAAAIPLYLALRRGYLDRQWEKQASYIEPAIESVRNVWKEFKSTYSYGTRRTGCRTGCPGSRVPVKRMTSNVGGSKFIIAAPTKMSSSASSIQVTRPLLASVFRSAKEVDKAYAVDTEKEFEEVA